MRIILKAWPWQGALFVGASFGFTLWWLLDAYGAGGASPADWLEPLAAMFGGLGAFALAAVLIFRKVDSARDEAGTYGLARGLATGYYFNFVRPLVLAIRDSGHPIHDLVSGFGGREIRGLVVAVPSAADGFDAGTHGPAYASLATGTGARLRLHELKVPVAGRPRPVFARLIVDTATGASAIADIPTTLLVIKDFAEHVARNGDDAADDEFVADARTETVAVSQTEAFVSQLEQVLEQFQGVIGRIGSAEADQVPVASLVHIVPLPRMKRRLDEVLDI